MFFTFTSPQKEGEIPFFLESLPPPNNFSGPNVWPNQYRHSIIAYGILNSIYTAKQCLWQTFFFERTAKERTKFAPKWIPRLGASCSPRAPSAEVSRCLWCSTLERAQHPGERLGRGRTEAWRRNTRNAKPTAREPLGTRPGPPPHPLKSQGSNLRKVLPVAQACFCWKHGGKWSTVSAVLPTWSAWGMDGKRSPSAGQVMLKQPWIPILKNHTTTCAGGPLKPIQSHTLSWAGTPSLNPSPFH